jgi:hypothetical protein
MILIKPTDLLNKPLPPLPSGQEQAVSDSSPRHCPTCRQAVGPLPPSRRDSWSSTASTLVEGESATSASMAPRTARTVRVAVPRPAVPPADFAAMAPLHHRVEMRDPNSPTPRSNPATRPSDRSDATARASSRPEESPSRRGRLLRSILDNFSFLRREPRAVRWGP